MNATRAALLFAVGFNAAIGTLCLWGYSVTDQGIFAATAAMCVVCGASAASGLKGMKAAQTAKGKGNGRS